MSDHRHFKDSVYEILARVGKALGAPKRLELLDLLCQGSSTVEMLSRQAAVSVANASQHLQILRAANLVTAQKHGVFVEYRLADDDVARCVATLRQLAESRFSDIHRVAEEFLGKEEGEPVSARELLRRHGKGEVVILDVRPAEEYVSGHLPGALSVPLPELTRRLNELPKRKEIVAYCRGPYCVMAAEAVSLLRKRGFRARRIHEGIADWKLQGLRLSSGNVENRP